MFQEKEASSASSKIQKCQS